MKKILIYLSIALIICILIINCMGGENDSTSNGEDVTNINENNSTTNNDWYSGGTLHKSDISEWKNATEENKLATCGDFVSIVNKNAKISDLKYEAEQLKICIDEATKGLDNTNSMKVSEVASQCIILME